MKLSMELPPISEWGLNDLQRQVRFAGAAAMTKTAHDIRAELRGEMQRVFDRPTLFTLNSMRVWPATPERMQAEVSIGDPATREHWLTAQVKGGKRMHKRFEDLLRQAGHLRADEYAVPGDAAKLNAYGNLSGPTIVKILSQLRAFRTSGFTANQSTGKRSVAKRRRQRYFVARGGESRTGLRSWRHGDKVQHLPTGIYLEDASDREFLKPIIMFVRGVRYQRRLPMQEIADRVVAEKIERNFDAALRKALASARWRL